MANTSDSVATRLAGGLQLLSPLELCDEMKVTAPSGGYTGGTLYTVGGITAICYQTAALGALATMLIRVPWFRFVSNAVATAGVAQGAKIYADVSNNVVTGTSATGLVLVGYARAAAILGATNIESSFDGFAAAINAG